MRKQSHFFGWAALKLPGGPKRLVAARKNELVYPFKRFDISHSFRGERAQAGRFRGSIQTDLDIIEEKLSVFSEIECLNALQEGLLSLRIPKFTIYVNHIDIPKY